MISRRIFIGGGVAAVAAASAFVALRPSGAAVGATLTVAEAHAAALAGDVLLVDIRRPDEWARTGVPVPAVPIDMRRPDFGAAVLDARASDTQPIAVICARGVRSRRLAALMEEAGLTPVLDVPEGMMGSRAGPGWLKAGLPVKEPAA